MRIVTDQASGSGVIFELDPIDGTALVATNEHVIEGASSIQAVSYLGETYGATLVGIDGIRDIAVLRICCSDSFLALDFADETTLRNGESVIVLGYPLGLPDLRVTQGIISALTYDNGIDRFEIQSDAAINPGNSGGPLMTTRGEVMGLTTFVVRATASGVSVEGFGFSISIRTLLPTLDKLKQGQFVALPTPTPHPSILNGVFSHPDLGYVINVPSGWVVEPRDSDGILIFDGNSLGWISVVVSNVDPSIYPTIAEYRRDWIPGPASTWTDFVIESEIVIFRGAVGTDTDVEGRDFQVRFVEDGNTFEATIQWFIVEGKRYAVAVSQTDFGGSDFGTQLQFAFISFRPFATRRVPTPTPSSFSGQSGGYSG